MRFALLSLVLAACGSMAANDGQSILGFTPSNIDLDTLDFTNVGDLVVGDGKTWMTDLGGLLGSSNSGTYNYQVVAQPGGLMLGVFTVNSLEVSANAVIHVEGVNGLVIVALDSITIDGELDGNSQASGGWTGPGGGAATASVVRGVGVGGGGAGTLSAAGAGAGFCGTGGSGGSSETAPAVAGATYGNAELVPLVAGSQGGSGNLGNGGAGGGAIQLVAANTIRVGGRIHLGGEGGYGSGVYNPGSSQTASGGGSGGALLLEAGSIAIGGTIAANGGGGGGDTSGSDASPDALAAPGGSSMVATATPGGHGGAATAIAGENGPSAAGANGGGGGGAVGRIRLNTLLGPAITGTLSPATSTPCATTGAVAP